MQIGEITRRDLDSREFSQYRQSTERIAAELEKRLAVHLEVLRPLFAPRQVLGSFIRSAAAEDVPHSEKSFARLGELYGSVCGFFGLPRALQPPLAPFSNVVEANALQYCLQLGGEQAKAVTVTSPLCWVLSYRSQSPLSRLQAMLSGAEPRQENEIRQTLIGHLIPVLLLERFPALRQVLEDLRYLVEVVRLADLGGLTVVTLRAPLEVFLPPDAFIREITGLSGIAAFQEIADPDALEKLPDPYRERLKSVAG